MAGQLQPTLDHFESTRVCMRGRGASSSRCSSLRTLNSRHLGRARRLLRWAVLPPGAPRSRASDSTLRSVRRFALGCFSPDQRRPNRSPVRVCRTRRAPPSTLYSKHQSTHPRKQPTWPQSICGRLVSVLNSRFLNLMAVIHLSLNARDMAVAMMMHRTHGQLGPLH